jgi:hypothetical protein
MVTIFPTLFLPLSSSWPPTHYSRTLHPSDTVYSALGVSIVALNCTCLAQGPVLDFPVQTFISWTSLLKGALACLHDIWMSRFRWEQGITHPRCWSLLGVPAGRMETLFPVLWNEVAFGLESVQWVQMEIVPYQGPHRERHFLPKYSIKNASQIVYTCQSTASPMPRDKSLFIFLSVENCVLANESNWPALSLSQGNKWDNALKAPVCVFNKKLQNRALLWVVWLYYFEHPRLVPHGYRLTTAVNLSPLSFLPVLTAPGF